MEYFIESVIWWELSFARFVEPRYPNLVKAFAFVSDNVSELD